MTMLMMLAFLIDQVQQLCCKRYQKARQRATGVLSVLFNTIRTLIQYAVWSSFTELLSFIGEPENRAPPEGAVWMTV